MLEPRSDLVTRWARRLLPGDLPRVEARQAKLILGTAMGLGAVIITGTLLRLLIGRITPPALWIAGGATLALLSVPFWLRRGAVDSAGVLTSTAFLAVVVGSGWSSGGLQAPVFLLLPAVPLLATFLIGPQAGLYTTATLLAFVVVLAFLGPLEPYDAPWRASAMNDVLARALMCGLALLVVGFFAAATEQQRRRSENRRRRSQSLYRRLFKQSKDTIAITTPSGRLIDVNQAGIDLFGFLSTAEATRFDLRRLYKDPKARDELARRVEADGFVREYESQQLTLDGREIVVRGTTSGIRNAAGEVTHWLSIVRDVTEARVLEAERIAMIAELERKNAELEHFTQAVSHDLKGPLFTLRGFLELHAGEKEVASEPAPLFDPEDLEIMIATADRMGVLLDDLLALSRLGHDAMPHGEVSMVEKAEEVVTDLGRRLRERGVEVEISPDLPPALGEPTLIRTLLQNLVENAIKFSAGVEAPKILIDHEEVGDEVVYSVTDNGPGIEPEDRDRVFGLFVRQDEGMAGSGIGLSAVEKVARLHGGRAWVGDITRQHGIEPGRKTGPGSSATGARLCFTLAPRESRPEKAGDDGPRTQRLGEGRGI